MRILKPATTSVPTPPATGFPDPAAPEAAATAADNKGGWLSVATTVAIILIGMLLVVLFQKDINRFGMGLIGRYGQGSLDIVLFLLTVISCSPICLPVWGYAVAGVAMGYNVIHLAIVMSLGSALGSLITYYLGRRFGESRFVKRRFPKAVEHPWIKGRSRFYVTVMLFLGTASPIPFDVLYLACGIKRYPPVLFYIANVGGRFIRYLYLGYGFVFFGSLF
jgi:membrane protein YqaA with SNARE-associated domain